MEKKKKKCFAAFPLRGGSTPLKFRVSLGEIKMLILLSGPVKRNETSTFLVEHGLKLGVKMLSLLQNEFPKAPPVTDFHLTA